MSNFPDQVPYIETTFSDASFAENPEPRCPCVLLLDVSGSMSGDPINELNKGLVQFKEELSSDAMALKRIEIAIVTFGPVRVGSEFQTADLFQPPRLSTNSDTPMGSAIEQGLGMLQQRKETYNNLSQNPGTASAMG